MENKKVYFTISVNKETAKEIGNYANFLNERNKYTHTDKEFVTDEDVIKGAIFRHLEIIDAYHGKLGYLKDIPNFKISNDFRTIAMKQGLDQSSISKLTGITAANISRVFNNRNEPSFDYFIRIWIALGCLPIEDLIKFEKNNPEYM